MADSGMMAGFGCQKTGVVIKNRSYRAVYAVVQLFGPVFIARSADALEQAVPYGQDLVPFRIAERVGALRFPVKSRLAPATFPAYAVTKGFWQLVHLSMQVQ